MVRYSICITHYNNYPTVKESLQSILNQIDEDFEVIVVDNLSNDGSEKVLQDFADQGKISLIRKRCSRGVGRQVAFEKSQGEYLIANLDLDDVFKPGLRRFLNFYHSKCEGFLLLAITDINVWAQNITIGPRSLISSLGGWRNLQYGEDWDLWARAAYLEKYRYTVFGLAEHWNPHPERGSLIGKLRFRYVRYRDMLRLGRFVFLEGEEVRIGQKFVFLMAKITSPFYSKYKQPMSQKFNPYDQAYLIESE